VTLAVVIALLPARPLRLVHSGSVTLLGLLFAAASSWGQSNDLKIDHVRVLVQDIGACQDVYRNTLGFNLTHADAVVYQEGSAHNTARLADGTYLELIGIANRERLLTARRWIIDFLQDHQGAHSVGVLVPSAKLVSDHLQSSGIDAPIYNLFSSRPGDNPVLIVTPKLANLPDGAVFFLQYPQESLERRSSLPPPENINTARGILAVWIVVNDLNSASNDAKALGFRPVRSQALGTTGREFETGRGKIVLLQGRAPDGPAARFTRDRGDAVVGISLAVDDLGQARELIEKNSKRIIESYPGYYGNSFLVPPELSCGTWIEMVQK
jgi:catechol 2,3-dioxygenase-like lactoylglutathione lyase family enzyme